MGRAGEVVHFSCGDPAPLNPWSRRTLSGSLAWQFDRVDCGANMTVVLVACRSAAGSREVRPNRPRRTAEKNSLSARRASETWPTSTVVAGISGDLYDPGYCLRARTILNVYDIQGNLVKTLIDEQRGHGSYQIEWDGTDNRHQAVSSGVYVYTLQYDSFKQSRKLLFVK